MKKSNTSKSQNPNNAIQPESKEHHDWSKRKREEELKRFEEIEDFGLEELSEDSNNR